LLSTDTPHPIIWSWPCFYQLWWRGNPNLLHTDLLPLKQSPGTQTGQSLNYLRPCWN
jgi:hypothetical protein